MALACGFLAMLTGCSDQDSTSDSAAPDAAVDAAVALDTGVSLEVSLDASPDAVDAATALDTGVSLEVSLDARKQPDAGACWFALSEIDQVTTIVGCPASISDVWKGGHTCDTGRFTFYRYTQCGQREVLDFDYASHCFYEAGSLVGLVLGDTRSLCAGGNYVEVGDTTGCPGPGVALDLCHAQDAGVVDTGADRE